MNLRYLRKVFLLLSFSLLTIQCSKEEPEELIYNAEECALLADLGQVELNPDSKLFIPYPDDIEKLIFVDESGQEYVATVYEYTDEHIQNTISATKPCPIANGTLVEYHFQSVFKRLLLEFEELDIWMSISVSTTISPDSYESLLMADVANIYLGFGEFGAANSAMTIVVDQRLHPMPYEDYSHYKKWHDVHGQIFRNVYVNDISLQEVFEIAYNTEIGLIGIRSIEELGIDLVYDRIE